MYWKLRENFLLDFCLSKLMWISKTNGLCVIMIMLVFIEHVFHHLEGFMIKLNGPLMNVFHSLETFEMTRAQPQSGVV